MKICPSGQGLTLDLRLLGQGCPALLTLSLLLMRSSTDLNPRRREALCGLHERRSDSSLVQRGREKPSEARRPGLQEGHPMARSPSKPQGKCWHCLGSSSLPGIPPARSTEERPCPLVFNPQHSGPLQTPSACSVQSYPTGTLLSPAAPPPTGLPGGTEARDLCICKVW